MAGAAPLPMRRILFQDLSLPGQPRDRSRPLAEILADEGIGPGGGSASSAGRHTPTRTAMETPGLPRRRAAPADRPGRPGRERDGPADRRRRTACASRTRSSSWPPSSTPPARRRSGVRRVLTGLRPGMTEREAVRAARLERDAAVLPPDADRRAARVARAAQPGRPPDRARRPVHRRVRRSGARSTCRAGFVVEDAAELPDGDRATTSSGSSRPYFDAVAEWYGALRIGQTGGALHGASSTRGWAIRSSGSSSTPGHQIHLDEWVNSPFAPGSTVELRSGMAFQVDIIPATGTDYFTTNIEDGIALADEALRAAFAGALPGGLGADRGAPARSWPTRSASSSTPTSCRSRTSRPSCRRSCSARTGR